MIVYYSVENASKNLKPPGNHVDAIPTYTTPKIHKQTKLIVTKLAYRISGFGCIKKIDKMVVDKLLPIRNPEITDK